jgi:homoserine kinase
VIVQAPATSANLGPGFDCAAVALDLWNTLEVTPGANIQVTSVEVSGEGAGELPADGTNLAVRAYALVASPAGKRFRFANEIPLERGLGSSAAAIALGLAAAAPDAPAEELLALGLQLESHADNLAAALCGGVCLTWEGRIAKVADRLPFVPLVLVPESRVSTETARSTLPDHLSHADAAFTAGRAALLGAGLASGRADVLGAAFADRLHEPYRAAAAPLLDAVRGQLPAGAAGVTLSGSGPSVVVWAEPARADECAAALRNAFPAERVLGLAVAPTGALPVP